MSKNKTFSETSAGRYSLALYELAIEANNLSEIEVHSASIINLIALSEIVNFNKITHNRMLIPKTNASYLNFEVFTPFITSSSAQIKVVFEEVGTGTTYEKIAEFSSPQFFNKQVMSVDVPVALKGKIVTISFEKVAMEHTDFLIFQNDQQKLSLSPQRIIFFL